MFNIIADKGTQGVHTYYTASMRWGELEHVLIFPEDLDDLDPDEQMQRALAKKRIGDLVTYLGEDDHFYSAITLVIMPRDLSRPALEGHIKDDADYEFTLYEGDGFPISSQDIGTLYLSGDVRLFPADGQHRSRSAIEMMKLEHSFAKEEVPVVLIPYENFGQVRQLFADLNLNAKPVSKATGLDFEGRNPAVLVIKDAVELVPLFRDRVNRRSNSLPKSSADVITLSTLKDGSEDIITALAKQAYIEDHGGSVPIWNPTTVLKAREEYLAKKNWDNATKELADAWTFITDLFPDTRDQILNGETTPGDVRDQYLYAFGLGQRAIASAAATLMTKMPTEWQKWMATAVHSFNWNRGADEWAGKSVLHGVDKDGIPTNRVNNTGPAIQELAKLITDTAIAAAKAAKA